MLPDPAMLNRIGAISAQGGLVRWQKWLLWSVLAFMVVVACSPLAFSVGTTLVSSIVVSTTIALVYLLYAIGRSGGGTVALPHRLLSDAECGTYTVVTAAAREKYETFQSLVKQWNHLDFPAAKLQKLIIVDEGDDATIAAARRAIGTTDVHLAIVPKDAPGPKGKPRALTWAAQAIGFVGQYTVIYDTEDLPDRDQLRKGATAFGLHPDIGCLQAELRWYNANQNWYTSMIQGVYSTHFMLKLRGLAAIGGVFPLGGTSNHIRTELLHHLGYWDPYNVTEDLDLGVKLSRAGVRCMMLPSTTLEEATTSFIKQSKQASRWFKGHTVTALVHLRQPGQLFRDLGPRRSLSFLVVVAFSHPAMLTAPLFWLLSIGYLLTKADVIHQLTPGLVYYIGTLCLLCNGAFVWLGMLACIRSGHVRLCLPMLTLPVYWATVLTAASFKAGRELVTGKWYYWDKTEHGIAVHQPPIHLLPLPKPVDPSTVVTASPADRAG